MVEREAVAYPRLRNGYSMCVTLRSTIDTRYLHYVHAYLIHNNGSHIYFLIHLIEFLSYLSSS